MDRGRMPVLPTARKSLSVEIPRLAELLFGLRHCRDDGTQEGIDSFGRLEYGGDVGFEDNDYDPLRHLFGKAIRLGSAVIEAVLFSHRAAPGLLLLKSGRFPHSLYAPSVWLCVR